MGVIRVPTLKPFFDPVYHTLFMANSYAYENHGTLLSWLFSLVSHCYFRSGLLPTTRRMYHFFIRPFENFNLEVPTVYRLWMTRSTITAVLQADIKNSEKTNCWNVTLHAFKAKIMNFRSNSCKNYFDFPPYNDNNFRIK